jgi:hypothetical protein
VKLIIALLLRKRLSLGESGLLGSQTLATWKLIIFAGNGA